MTANDTNGQAKGSGRVAGRILVIDDEEVIHASLNRILGRAGHGVDAAFSASEGLERLATGGYDLVISDLIMPKMDGLELLEQLRQSGCRVPILMITGLPTIRTALQALRLGAVDYLAKPFTRKELLAPVSRALRRRADESVRVATEAVAEEGESSADAADGASLPALQPGDICVLREHSWARYRSDGSMDVGIEASFLCAVGSVAAVEAPGSGDLVEQGYVGIQLSTAGREEHGVLMPLSGQVIATNTGALQRPEALAASDWIVRIVPGKLADELQLLDRRRGSATG